MAKINAVSTNNKASLSRFIKEQVGPISEAFSQTPLTRLRVKTSDGAVTLVKAKAAPVAALPAEATHPHERGGHGARLHNPESGRSFDTISADVVGVFRDLPEQPAAGARLNTGQLIGHIEALRLRNAVRCPVECTLIAQVVVDGQPVDFGETLFVVDSGGAPAPLEIADSTTDGALLEPIEPPRL